DCAGRANAAIRKSACITDLVPPSPRSLSNTPTVCHFDTPDHRAASKSESPTGTYTQNSIRVPNGLLILCARFGEPVDYHPQESPRFCCRPVERTRLT